MRLNYLLLGITVVLGLTACGSAAAEEPTENQMKEAMLYAMNHPPGEPAGDPITIKFFKKEACDNPTPQGYHCTFDVQVLSTNLGASMYNNIPGAVFYKDQSGKWAMRPPF
jgi:hypothetical protein